MAANKFHVSGRGHWRKSSGHSEVCFYIVVGMDDADGDEESES